MAFVDTVDTDNTGFGDKTMDTVHTDVHIDLPSWDDHEEVSNFVVYLHNLGDIRGVKTLRKYVHKYLDATRIAERHMRQVITSANTINGVAAPRVALSGLSNELRRFKRASRTYFSGLNTPELQRQCEVFGLDYDSYATTDEAIAALVEANVAKRNME
jgi:hypothetical protein